MVSHRIDRPSARFGPGHPRRDAGAVERGGLENYRHIHKLLIENDFYFYLPTNNLPTNMVE